MTHAHTPVTATARRLAAGAERYAARTAFADAYADTEWDVTDGIDAIVWSTDEMLSHLWCNGPDAMVARMLTLSKAGTITVAGITVTIR